MQIIIAVATEEMLLNRIIAPTSTRYTPRTARVAHSVRPEVVSELVGLVDTALLSQEGGLPGVQ